jgi:UDP-N-acetylglucosamine transferase subunit ALG13
MIFVTVGAQMPFDRLIRAADEWALTRERPDVFAQIGDSDYRAKSIETKRHVDPLDFRKCIQAASVIVAHAGMGTIITALEFAKPIIVMPRRADLRETRNDHQVATAKYFNRQGRITVAFDENELINKLDQFEVTGDDMEPIDVHASPQLIAALRGFLEADLGSPQGLPSRGVLAPEAPAPTGRI